MQDTTIMYIDVRVVISNVSSYIINNDFTSRLKIDKVAGDPTGDFS